MARPFSRALGVGWMGVGRWRIAWVVAGRKVVRGSWVAMGPLILSIASSVFGLRTAPPRVTRHSSVVGCRLSVVGCRLLFIVVRRRWSNVGRTDWTERIAPFVARHASPFSTFFVGKLVDILRIKRSTP
ncbi:hypothetical protein [Burkholderia pseudomallei]|uniref:hypothetical protein n=1 Tax=Burkholderia pseudomallei TaxID=28450 RepID=UPI0013662396|nr:hypothetical protein [Burkholderia pseudomallei]